MIIKNYNFSKCLFLCETQCIQQVVDSRGERKKIHMLILPYYVTKVLDTVQLSIFKRAETEED